jgi:hypothetical protein
MLATKVNMQNPYEEIMIRQFYKWAVVKIPEYCIVYDNSKEMTTLKHSFRKAQTHPGTQKIHCVITASKNQVQREVISKANVFQYICKMSIKWKTLGDL